MTRKLNYNCKVKHTENIKHMVLLFKHLKYACELAIKHVYFFTFSEEVDVKCYVDISFDIYSIVVSSSCKIEVFKFAESDEGITLFWYLIPVTVIQ